MMRLLVLPLAMLLAALPVHAQAPLPVAQAPLPVVPAPLPEQVPLPERAPSTSAARTPLPEPFNNSGPAQPPAPPKSVVTSQPSAATTTVVRSQPSAPTTSAVVDQSPAPSTSAIVVRPPAPPTAAIALQPLAPSTVAIASQPPAPPTATILSLAPRALTELPLDSGLPLWIRAGLAFVAVEAIDENEQSFKATVDMRLSWLDQRLRYPAVEAPVGYREWRNAAVATQLAAIWSPKVGFANLRGEPIRESRSLRRYPDGRVELLRRVEGTFNSSFDVGQFPFDRQQLKVELVSQDETSNRLNLDFRQDDLLFSRADPNIKIGGWTLGSVNLSRDPLAGWYGENYARMRAALEVQRRAAETVPALFVPLLASLLIPLLATWLNRSNDGVFEIKAFEMTNIVIGGLFAVIALNFTVNSDRSILASSTNTISLLFGLNYLALAIALVINVCLFRFNVVRAFAGRHVQHETFLYIIWALPLAIAATAVALILIAAA